MRNPTAARASPGKRRRRAERRRREREAFKICGDQTVRGGQVGIGADNLGSAMARLNLGTARGVPNVRAFTDMVGPEPDISETSGINMPNVTVGGLVSTLATLGSTVAGRNWALKALHPNGEEVTNVSGIPDHTMVPVVTPEFRTNVTIAGESTTAGNDDVDIITLPFADLPAIWRRYKAGAQPDRWKGWNPIWHAALSNSENAIEFVGVGTDGVDAHWVPRVKSSYVGNYGSSRATYQGITVHLDAAALYDQGRVYAGQVTIPWRQHDTDGLVLTGWEVTDETVAPTGSEFEAQASVYQLNAVPLDEGCLVQAAPGHAEWEARKGIYMPIRFRDPIHLFEDLTNADADNVLAVESTANPPNTIGLETATTYAYDETTTENLPALIGPAVRTNLLTGVVLFRGIAPTANLQVKLRTGLEVQIPSCTVTSPYQHQSPILDQMAIDRVTELAQVMPQVYPACYNDLGAIIGSIIGAVKTIAPIAKNILGGLGGMGIPVISDIAGGASGVLTSLGLGPRRYRAGRRAMRYV